MTVISPAIGPVWAARQTAPSLPTAALPRPWWPLQTRQATAWRAPASAREVGVDRAAAHCWTGTHDRLLSALILPPVIHRLMFPSLNAGLGFPLCCLWMLCPGCAWHLLHMAGLRMYLPLPPTLTLCNSSGFAPASLSSVLLNLQLFTGCFQSVSLLCSRKPLVPNRFLDLD